MYFVTRHVTGGTNFSQILHAIDITTGNDAITAKTISATVQGSGDGASGGAARPGMQHVVQLLVAVALPPVARPVLTAHLRYLRPAVGPAGPQPPWTPNDALLSDSTIRYSSATCRRASDADLSCCW